MTPEAKAIEEWFESEEGKKCSDPTGLKAPIEMKQFLKNRLWRAFTDGIKTGEMIVKGKMVGKFNNFINNI